jgi:bifunctional DNA-binding transcriptional regulator/antitoxin component of YhaV-PrlF toxin-antitoxin module
MGVDVEDGRIRLPEAIREKFGSRFELVDQGNSLVLVPVADDPLEALREETSETDKSVEELKESAMKEALDQAGS